MGFNMDMLGSADDVNGKNNASASNGNGEYTMCSDVSDSNECKDDANDDGCDVIEDDVSGYACDVI